MAKARFHSLRGEKSALIAVKPNSFQLSNTFVYLDRSGVASACKKTQEELVDLNWDSELIFDIPNDYRIVDLVGSDGEPRTTKEGEVLRTLVW